MIYGPEAATPILSMIWAKMKHLLKIRCITTLKERHWANGITGKMVQNRARCIVVNSYKEIVVTNSTPVLCLEFNQREYKLLGENHLHKNGDLIRRANIYKIFLKTQLAASTACMLL